MHLMMGKVATCSICYKLSIKLAILFGFGLFNFSRSSQLSKFIRDEVGRWQRWIQEFIWSSQVSIHKCEWIKKQNRDRERNWFHSVAKNMKDSISYSPSKFHQTNPKYLGTIHSPRSQIKKALTYLLLVQSTSVYINLEKHWSNGLFSHVLKNQNTRWSISFISSHCWDYHVGW